MTTVLRATDIEHAYGLVTVLEGVSLTVDAGTVTALLGPNGSGKTTLLRALAGLHEPTGGDVVYDGPDVARPLGYLPQRPAFRPGQTVLEALSFYASLVGLPPSSAMATLDRVGLRDATGRDVDALSGGMTRLVAIAQATIGQPPLVVLDEPASGLDPEMRLHIFDVLADLASAGTAVLLSSHDLGQVERTADRVALLDEGTIVERGSPEAVCAAADADTLLDAFRTTIAGETGRLRVRGVSA